MAPNPVQIVVNIYQFALLIGGLLAFGAIVYGGIKYAIAAGNPGGQSDARDQITQALLGLLLLLGAYVIFTTIGITGFGLPAIQAITLPPSPTIGGGSTGVPGTCTNCVNGPGVARILSCLQSPYRNVPATTFQGSHAQNSCHFGGRTCTDGAHAIDFGFNGLSAAGVAPIAMWDAVNNCGASTGVPTSCRCETPAGAIVPCSNPSANHVHCNVDNAACGCN